MNLKGSYVILGLLICVNALPEGHIAAFIELTGLSYEDACSDASQSRWNFIKKPNNETLTSWTDALKEYGLLKRKQKEEIGAFTNKTESNEAPSSLLEYKYNLVSKPGDALLQSEDWEEFVAFIGQAELLKLSGNYSSEENKLFREDAENSLARIGTPEDKLKTWSSWHKTLKPLTTKFSHNLQLLHEAAKANDANNVAEYWEILSEYENGYREAVDKWNEIARLHKSFLKFVQSRLANKYEKSIAKDVLPAYLLGSLQGYDWTPLAIDVIPDAKFVFEIRKNLWEKGLVGKKLYKSASRLGNVTLKHLPEAEFFEESDFEGQCPPCLINLCRDGKMRVSTCSDSSIANYLSTHKNIAKILIHQMSDESSPILNVANRYSALEEGVSELFGILAASRAWLLSLNLVNETDDLDQAQIVSVMITALDILPRMAYYLSADMWRIDAITKNISDPEELTKSWWQFRSQYEGITPNSMELPTFLDDNFIISNRPYLSKFFGTMLGFQIYEYLMESTEVRIERIETNPINYNYKSQLIKMIRHGSAENWSEIIREYLNFYDVSANAMLRYFAPLEQYLDEVEYNDDDPMPTELEDDLEKLENQFRHDFNNPTTSTTTTTTMKTTAVPKTEATTKKIKIPPTIESPKSQQRAIPPKSQAIPDRAIQADATIAPEQTLQSNSDFGQDDKSIKSGTSKAVWAVGAVLIATVVIIIISVFGRQRCRKTPKNRRYV